MTRKHDRGIGWTWVFASIVLIVLATVTPQPELSQARREFFSLPLLSRTGATRDIIQNVLLYLPLGALVGLSGASLMRALLAGALVSLGSELIQFAVPGREAAIADLVTNITGTLAGWLIVATPRGNVVRRFLLKVETWLRISLRPDRRLAATLSLVWAVLVALVVAATGWLLTPSLPPPFFYAIASPFVNRSPGPLRIGSDGSPRGVFNGLIDEVRVYRRARSDDEIRSDMGRAVSSDQPDPDRLVAHGFDGNNGEERVTSVTRDELVARNARRASGGRFGSALALDGRPGDGFVSNETLELPDGFTLEAWVLPAARMPADVPVIAGADDAFYLRASTSFDPLVPSAGGRFGAARTLRLKQRIPLQQWTHLAATYDGRSLKMYVDGAARGEMVVWSSHHLMRISLDDVDLPFGPVPNPKALHSQLLNEFVLRLSVRCGELQPPAAPLFTAAGIQSVDALVIEGAAAELRVRYPSRARRLGFASADYRVPGALASCRPGQTISFAVNGPLQNPSVEDAGGRRMWGIGPGIASAWTVPIDSQRLPVWLVVTLSMCYLASLLIPFGYWARSSPLTALGAILLGTSVFLVPLAMRIKTPDVFDVVAIAGGVLAGVLFARLRRVRGEGSA